MTIQELLIDPLQFQFMQRALLAILFIGIVSGVMGTYVVTRGMSFLGDALAHSVLPGVAIVFISGGTSQASLLGGGLVAGIASAVMIGILTRGQRLTEDTAIGIVFAGTLALGIGIISSARSFATDLTHILIGNILAVSNDDLMLIGLIGLVILIFVALFYKEFMVISFDTTLAETLRLPSEWLRILLLVLLACAIVVGVEAVGITLVAAMLVTPSATARFFTKRLHHMMLLSSIFACVSGFIGMYIAWHINIAPSASIVLAMTALFGLAFFFAPDKGYLWSLLGRAPN